MSICTIKKIVKQSNCPNSRTNLVPCHRKLEQKNDETGEKLPLSNGSHQVLDRILGLLSFRRTRCLVNHMEWKSGYVVN